MRVARLHGPGDVRLHDEEPPEPEPGESVVRVTAVGLCGSDLHWFAEGGIGDARLARPLVLGHELAGVVESGPRRGERVAVDPAVSCGACERCAEGNPNLCPDVRFAGHGATDGALRERLTWPDTHLFPLPDSLSDADGAMLEPLGVALHMADLARLRPGQTVGVFGCGPIGLLVIQLARLAGAARIVATERLGHRIAAAQSFGASVVPVHGAGADAAELLRATDGRGLDVALEVAGENAAVEAAVEAVRPGGLVVLAGIPAEDRTAFSASAARRKGLTLKLVRRMKDTYPRAIRLARDGGVDVRGLVTHRFPLADVASAFDAAARREGLKVLVEP
jgi:L-iditol 2-dehydrogenase